MPRSGANLDQVPAIVKAHGGKYLVRGGTHEVIRGDWTPDRLVVLEFDTVEQAKAWQNAPGLCGDPRGAQQVLHDQYRRRRRGIETVG